MVQLKRLGFQRHLLFLSILIPWVDTITLGQNSTASMPSRAISADVPERSPINVVGGDYVLRPNDVISVTVFGESDLNRDDRLVSDGTVMLPLVGRIRVAGQTSVQAAETIRAALAKDYLVNPQVSVSITETVKETFTIIGQVSAPGSYPLPPGGRMSLLQAIGSAGGFKPSASTGKITVKRKEGGRETVFKVDGKSQVSNSSDQTFEVRAGDVINVPERLF
jgi:polysaccharide export outer membrane protein